MVNVKDQLQQLNVSEFRADADLKKVRMLVFQGIRVPVMHHSGRYFPPRKRGVMRVCMCVCS